MKKALVMGAGGFIGGHLVQRLKDENYFVVAADLKFPEHRETSADEFHIGDLSDRVFTLKLLELHRDVAEIYQLAADMGGAGFIFTGENDLDVMENSAGINLALTWVLTRPQFSSTRPKIFYSSSACIYPEGIQSDPLSVDLREENAYPANPDSEYGWEKLFSERLFFALERNYAVPVRVARFHNVYGPYGTWEGGREKAPAAICRKVAESDFTDGIVEVWGNGTQTRSFLYIDDCIEAVRRFMSQEEFSGPVNIGSEEQVSLNDLVLLTSKIAKLPVQIRNVPGPVGVMGRNSNNDLIREKLNWDYQFSLEEGVSRTYRWIRSQVELKRDKRTSV
jgi:GDP-D-mannose 3',5'-epimerase